MSVIPVRSWRTGEASRSRTATDAIVIRTGRRHDPGHEAAPEAAALLLGRAPVEPGQRGLRPSGGPARCGNAAASRGSQAAGRPRLTLSPRIASVAGRNVRLPTTDTKTTEIVPIAIDVNSDTPRVIRPGQRDHHRQPGEEDRPAGGAAGDLDRLGPVAAGPPLDPEAGDHEQRVVDRDGEPDEHDQLGRVRADRPDDLAVDAEDPERGDQRGDRQDQRHDRRDDRPEREQQDHERQRDRQPQGLVEALR